VILALLLACAAEPAAVAPVSKPVPALSPAAASADALVPEGWTVVQQLSGDLDGDNIADEVALLSRTVGDELQATLRLRMKGVVRCAIPAGPRPDLFSYDHGSFEAPRCP
jgi:hypothetical protein